MGSASYADLLREAQPQIICDEKTHSRALARVDSLMKKSRLTAAEAKLLDLLSKLINDYEETIYPTPEVSVSAMLEHLLDAKATTQAELARQTGVSCSTISEVLKGKRRLSVENAFRLAKYFHVDATLFLENR
jgi:HTH-type transcriptional regulator/antitoxin HigA